MNTRKGHARLIWTSYRRILWRSGAAWLLFLSLLLYGAGCSDAPDDGLWRGRIDVDKGVRKISSSWPVMHHPDSLAEIAFKEDTVIEGQVDDKDRSFISIFGITTDLQGNIYMADTPASRILKYDAAGQFVVSIGSNGVSPMQFKQPVDIATDKTGNLYVVDFELNRVTIFDKDFKLLNIFDIPIVRPRRIEIDSEGYILIFAITQHDLIYKFSTKGEFVGSFYDPGESMRIMGTMEQLIAFSDAMVVTTEDGSILVSSRHPYRILKMDGAAESVMEFGRVTPFDVKPVDFKLVDPSPGTQIPPMGISGMMAVLPDGRIMNIVHSQKFKNAGIDSYGNPQYEIIKVDRWLDVFTPEGKWEMTSRVGVPGFLAHADSQGRVYFIEMNPPRVTRYVVEFPPGASAE